MSINFCWEKRIISPASSYFPQNVPSIILSPEGVILKRTCQAFSPFYALLPPGGQRGDYSVWLALNIHWAILFVYLFVCFYSG